MGIKNIHIYCCSPPDSTTFDLYKSVDKLKLVYDNLHLHLIKSNIDGLSKRYNESINNHLNNVDDILVFVHDDVYINDIQFVDKVLKYIELYDILGVAGAKTVDIGSPIIAWHLTKKEHLFGSVQHTDYKNDWMIDFSKGIPLPQQVITIDGLLMIMNHNAFSTIKFDEQFDFHHYDLDMCLSAYINNLKVGVVPIMVTHGSIGDGILSDSYKQLQNKLLNKWRDEL